MKTDNNATALQQTLLEVIQKAQNKIDNGVSLASQQLPDVVEQLLRWSLYRSILTILICGLLFIGLYIWYKKLPRDDGKLDVYHHDGLIQTFYITAFILTALNLICIIDAFYNILQILITPKVWLIEYVANLFKR